MTATELLDQIRQEINRLKSQMKGLEPQSDFRRGQITGYNQLYSFLDTLQVDEPKTREAEVILNGHGLLVDVTRYADGYKLKVIVEDSYYEHN